VLSPVSIQTQSLALRALRKRKPQETQAIAFEWKPGFTHTPPKNSHCSLTSMSLQLFLLLPLRLPRYLPPPSIFLSFTSTPSKLRPQVHGEVAPSGQRTGGNGGEEIASA